MTFNDVDREAVRVAARRHDDEGDGDGHQGGARTAPRRRRASTPTVAPRPPTNARTAAQRTESTIAVRFAPASRGGEELLGRRESPAVDHVVGAVDPRAAWLAVMR